jgi:diacylglycerol kinase (ATP)
LVLTGILQAEAIWWGLVVAVLAAASAMEIANAAFEALIDHLHPERHPHIGAAKDMASAAAFTCNCASMLVVVVMLLDHVPYQV